MAQTAVEWLIKQVNHQSWGNVMIDIPKEVIVQAKQMEKEQIMMAVKDSWYMAKGSNFHEPQAEQYYNETYETI